MFGWVMAAYRNAPVIYLIPGGWGLLCYLAQAMLLLIILRCAAQTGIGRGEEDARTSWIQAYVQDNWRATRNLTIDAGLRYEFNGHVTETGNRLSNMQLDRLVIASDDAGRIHLVQKPICCGVVFGNDCLRVA